MHRANTRLPFFVIISPTTRAVDWLTARLGIHHQIPWMSTQILLTVIVSLDVTSCSPVEIYRSFGVRCCYHLQVGDKVHKIAKGYCLVFAVEYVARMFPSDVGKCSQAKQRHNPEHGKGRCDSRKDVNHWRFFSFCTASSTTVGSIRPLPAAGTNIISPDVKRLLTSSRAIKYEFVELCLHCHVSL
jgi:hypothetical protein